MNTTVLRNVLCLGLGLVAWPARAVLVLTTADPNFNTSAPTGLLADSGWQYQGQWGDYLGTPIAPYAFITAKHVGGQVGGAFTFNQVSYTTTAYYDSPTSDLRVWRVSAAFSDYAPLYTSSSEVGQSLVVFGRGTQRGSEVRVSGNLRGWQWGTADHRQRWGENAVSGIVEGGAGLGQMLQAGFDYAAGGNEAHLSLGDSGGGVFIEDGGVWKLAGINVGVDAKFSYSGVNGSGFDAAIFDAGGLYFGQDGQWQYIFDQPTDIASAFYATRISANADWIATVVPEPGAIALVAGLGLFGWAAVRRRSRKGEQPLKF